MSKKKRQIDVVSTSISLIEGASGSPSFSDILGMLDNKEYRYQGKKFELSLLDTNLTDCIIGIIVTTQDKDIPPMRDKVKKIFSPIAINPATHGLAFANIFLYDNSRNVLLYEINRNGCFLKQFKEFIYTVWNSEDDDIRFEINFPAIIRANEYNRMLTMDYYKKILIELYNPVELIHCFEEENDSMQNSIIRHQIEVGRASNADSLKIEELALTKKLNPLGLSRSMTVGLIDAVKLNIADKGFRSNIQTLRIDGYASDVEDSKSVKHINILADTFNEYFKIEDILIQSDVQEYERKTGIESVYRRILPELRQLVG